MRKAVVCRLALVGMGALFICTSRAAAEEPSPLRPGARIRVTYQEWKEDSRHATRSRWEERRYKGKVLELTETTLILETSSSDPPLIFDKEKIIALERSVAPSRRRNGALIGMGVGAGVGLILGLNSGDDKDGIIRFSSEGKGGILALFFAPIGAFVGVLVAPGEKWEAVFSDQVHLDFNIGTRGEPGILVSFHF